MSCCTETVVKKIIYDTTVLLCHMFSSRFHFICIYFSGFSTSHKRKSEWPDVKSRFGCSITLKQHFLLNYDGSKKTKKGKTEIELE